MKPLIHEQLDANHPELVRKEFGNQERRDIWQFGQNLERMQKEMGLKKEEWKKEAYWKDLPAQLEQDPYPWSLRKVKAEYVKMVR